LDEEAPYCPYCRKQLRLTSTPPIKPNAEENNYWICPNCKAVNDIEDQACHNCRKPKSNSGRWETAQSYQESYERPSTIWYLVSFLFGLIGGIVAYVAIKEKDERMANTCIAIGLVTFLIGVGIMSQFYPSIL
jgi:hypothetical protein